MFPLSRRPLTLQEADVLTRGALKGVREAWATLYGTEVDGHANVGVLAEGNPGAGMPGGQTLCMPVANPVEGDPIEVWFTVGIASHDSLADGSSRKPEAATA